MIVSYCKSCLPGNKVILDYSERITDLRVPHNAHPQIMKNGWMALSVKQWATVFVDGDDVQTKANIVASFGDRLK